MAIIAMDTQPVRAKRRQRIVSEVMEEGVSSPREVHEILAARGVVSASSGKPFSLSTIRNDMRALTASEQQVSEIIGRVEWIKPFWADQALISVDQTQAKYSFWDELRQGEAKGFTFGGLFCKPLTQIIASYVFGSGVQIELVDGAEGPEDRIEYTNQLLSRFAARYRRLLLDTAVDSYALGDQYIAVNPDTTLTRVSPELVELIWNPVDYRRIERVKVTTRLEKNEITDEYDREGRKVTIRSYGKDQNPIDQGKLSYNLENLIGRLPIVHFPNDRSGNEIYGRPIYYALYHLFARYDDLIRKGLDGAELMGNPIPVFEGMENIAETIAANSTAAEETYTDADGYTESRTLIRWDLLSALFIGRGGSFNFKSPGAGFTADVRDMLKSLFLLMLDHTRVPEGVWGAAVPSSRASVDSQMPPFHQYIDGRRLQFEGEGGDVELGLSASGGLHELLDVWLRMKALTDPRVIVAPIAIKWPELAQENWEIVLKWVQYLEGRGIIDKETALVMFGKVEDPAAVIEKAQEEGEEAWKREQERQPDNFPRDLADAERQADEDARRQQEGNKDETDAQVE